MWNKIYSMALAISLLIMSSLSFYAFSWLKSIDAPVNVVQNYEYYSGLAWIFLWLSSIILLVLANAFYWRTQQPWALWTTFLYFALFIILQTFWFDESFVTYKNRSGLGQNTLSLGLFLGVTLCIVGAVIVFFDQFLLSRLHKKMYGVAPEEVQMASEEAQ
jgi:hypothetical protein